MAVLTAEVGRDLGGEFDLPWLVAQRPKVDALASSFGVSREQLGAVIGGPDAHLGAEPIDVAGAISH